MWDREWSDCWQQINVIISFVGENIWAVKPYRYRMQQLLDSLFLRRKYGNIFVYPLINETSLIIDSLWAQTTAQTFSSESLTSQYFHLSQVMCLENIH